MKKKRNSKRKSQAWHSPNNLIAAYVLNCDAGDNSLYQLPEQTDDFEKAYEFFDHMFQHRMNMPSYSVKDIAEKKGIDYQQVVTWSKQNDLFAFGLEMAREACFIKAQNDLLENRIEWEIGIRYCVENSESKDERARHYWQELEKIELEKTKGSFFMEKNPETNKPSTDISNEQPERQKAMDSFVPAELEQEVPKQTSTLKDQRIKDWKLKSANSPRIYFEKVGQEGKITQINRKVKNNDSLSEKQRNEIIFSEQAAVTGSVIPEFSNIMFSQTINALCLSEIYSDSKENIAKAIWGEMLSLKPADSFEGMLISRLLVLHNQYMHYLSQAAGEGSIDSKEKHLNNATKLMRVYNETLEALNKHRRKGEQKVTVTHNHVNVNEGGKAIVGSEINQQTGGGDHDKK